MGKNIHQYLMSRFYPTHKNLMHAKNMFYSSDIWVASTKTGSIKKLNTVYTELLFSRETSVLMIAVWPDKFWMKFPSGACRYTS